MAETTTIRLPPELRARLARIAKDTDRSVHSLIIEGIERYAAYEEELKGLARNAPHGKVYRAEDVHAWAERLARGEAAPFPHQEVDARSNQFNDASQFPTASHAGVRANHARSGHETTSNVPPIR